MNKYKHNWYIKNQERILKERKEYRKENLLRIREYDRKRGKIRRQNPEYIKKVKLSAKLWRIKNKDKLNARSRYKHLQYRIKFPIKKIVRTKEELLQMARIRNKRYYLKHKSRLNKTANIVNQKRIKSDLNFRLKVRMRYRLWKALKKNKRKTTLELLGCSIPELKLYLEKKFTEGMTWENYGRNGWTVDHIYPLSKADLTNKKELEKVCNFTNLQPLWENENCSKRAKIIC